MLWDPRYAEEVKEEEKDEVYLWRFMIGADHQGKDYGAAALDLLIEHARSIPDMNRFSATFVEGDGGPEGFYLSLIHI